MNTPTQSNTLPAIRALLWERWRVMRGSFLLFWAGYAILLFVAMRITDLVHNRAAPLLISDWHLFVFPFLLPFGIASMFMSGPGGRNVSPTTRLGLSPHIKVLPVHPTIAAISRLCGTALGAFVLVLGTLAVDWIVAGEYAFVLYGPVSVLFLLVIAFSILLNLWVAVVPWERVALAAFIFVPLMTVIIVTRGMEVPAIPMALGCIAIGLPIAGIAHRAGRSGWLEGALGHLHRPPTGAQRLVRITTNERSMLSTIMAYEWRVWGRYLFGFSLLLLTGYGAASTVSPGARGFILSIPLVLLFLIFLFGSILSVQESSSNVRPSRFQLLQPTTTQTLALGRIFMRATLLLASLGPACALMIAVPALEALNQPNAWSMRSVEEFGGYAMGYMIAGWVLLNMGWIVALLFLAAIGFTFTLHSTGWAETLNTSMIGLEVFGRLDSVTIWIVMVSAFCAAAALACLRLRVTSWLTIAGLGIVCGIVPFALSWGFSYILVDVLYFSSHGASQHPIYSSWMLLTLASLALYAATLWQFLWLHRCRHGGLGWRFWRGR